MDEANIAYVVALDDDNQIRVLLWTERGTVYRFTVQQETRHSGEFQPVIRYDSAHDTAHRDTLDDRARTVSKRWLPNLSFPAAATFAIRDIKANWERYLADYRARTPR